MPEAEDIELVVNALKKVPAKSLRLIELANAVPIRGGDLDPFVLSDMIPEINRATQEAVAYGSQTIQAVDALVRMHGKKAAPELRPLTDEDLEAGLQF